MDPQVCAHFSGTYSQMRCVTVKQVSTHSVNWFSKAVVKVVGIFSQLQHWMASRQFHIRGRVLSLLDFALLGKLRHDCLSSMCNLTFMVFSKHSLQCKLPCIYFCVTEDSWERASVENPPNRTIQSLIRANAIACNFPKLDFFCRLLLSKRSTVCLVVQASSHYYRPGRCNRLWAIDFGMPI
jgi:hypothetical protein